jgi:hypothetical protein
MPVSPSLEIATTLAQACPGKQNKAQCPLTPLPDSVGHRFGEEPPFHVGSVSTFFTVRCGQELRKGRAVAMCDLFAHLSLGSPEVRAGYETWSDQGPFVGNPFVCPCLCLLSWD